MSLIYKITNTITNKIYVGKTTKTLHERMSGHRDAAKAASQTYLHRAIRKYGIKNFTMEPLFAVFDESDIDFYESYFISELAPHYNMTKGGEGGDTSSSENFISGMKRYHDSKTYSDYATYGMLGKTHSYDAKVKQSEARKKFWSSKTKDDMIEMSEKYKGENNPMFGKTPNNAIRVIYEGVEYPSIAKAARETGKSTKFILKYGEVIKT